MSKINNLKDLFKKFEGNIDNKIGIDFLSQALSEAEMILEESGDSDRKEIDVCRNIINAYQKKTIEKAKSFDIKTGHKILEIMVDILATFNLYDFVKEPDFNVTQGKTLILYLDALHSEYGIKEIAENDKKELIKSMKKLDRLNRVAEKIRRMT